MANELIGLSELPKNNGLSDDTEKYPSLYRGEFTTVDFLRRTYDATCPPVIMRSRVTISLRVEDTKFGLLRVWYFLHDHLENIPQTETTLIETPVSLRPAKPIQASDPFSRDYLRFFWAVPQGSTCRIKLYCHDKYRVIVDGKSCYSYSCAGTYEGNLTLVKTTSNAVVSSNVVLET